MVAVVLATCDVISTFGSSHSGWPSGRGSGSVTSSSAPPRWPDGERGDERVGVDQPAASDVDQHRVGPHAGERVGVQQVVRGRRQRRDEHHDVALAQQLGQGVRGQRAVGAGDGSAGAREGERPHAERCEVRR